VLLSLAWAALRRRPFSVLVTVVLGSIWSSLLDIAVPAAVPAWACGSLLGLGLWYALEPKGMGWLGARRPSRIEHERLASAVSACGGVPLLVVDQPSVWVQPSLRHILVSRGALDLFEDRELIGLITQAAARQRLAGLVGEPSVWLGNLFLLGNWVLGGWLIGIGELLARVLAWSLVLPALLWPDRFRIIVGRLLGWMLIGLLGTTLISVGWPAVGLALLTGQLLVPGLRALLAWETRRAEAIADRSTAEAGQGWYLLEALEALAWADELLPPSELFALLRRPGAALPDRIERLWQQLNTEPKA